MRYEGRQPSGDDARFPTLFDYDPSKCIVCSRCVRACEDQGTFGTGAIQQARFLTPQVKRGGEKPPSIPNACRAVRACRKPAANTPGRRSVIGESGQPERNVITTCYCGVGCLARAEMKASNRRAWSRKNGQASHGHSPSKGRFAGDYATHRTIAEVIRKHVVWQSQLGQAVTCHFQRSA